MTTTWPINTVQRPLYGCADTLVSSWLYRGQKTNEDNRTCIYRKPERPTRTEAGTRNVRRGYSLLASAVDWTFCMATEE